MKYNIRCTKCGRFVPENNGIDDYTCKCGFIVYHNDIPPTTEGLPFIDFDYPSSETGESIPRLVWVTKVDEKYIEGFEVVNLNSKSQSGKFKKFLKDKIRQGFFEFVEFNQK
jgi:hypothetical protein